MSFLSERFDEAVRKNRERTALVDETGRSWTFGELGDDVDRLAARIRDEVPGSAVGILLLNSQRYLVSMLALWKAGKTAVPLNYLLPPQDLGFILKDSGMSGLIASGFFDEALGKIRPLFDDRGTILMADADDFIPAEGTIRGGADPDPAPALFLYTSGTTGRPKGVVLTATNLVTNVASCQQAGGFDETDSFLCLLPFFHTYAITGTFLLPLLNGAKMVLVDRFQPVKVLNLIARHRTTCFLAIPSMYRVLAGTDGEFDFSSVRFPISGGEPLPVAIAEAFENRFGVQIYEGYGQTEAAPVVALNVPGKRKLGTVGQALPGVELAIWNDQNQPVPAGVVGEIMVRGANVMAGYHRLPDETAKTITDGWLHTGDLGYTDDEGFVTITGRINDLIISAGENIYPREIEEALVEHPLVSEVAVIGIPDDVRGEVPKAFVIGVEGADLDEKKLRSFCKERIAAYKVPKVFELVRDLPRTPTGKVLKRMLK
jgi:long-chain acyl-CoA synthetase